MKHRHPAVRVLRHVPTAVLLALLVACGGDDKESEAAPARKTARKQPAAGDVAPVEAAAGDKRLANAVVTGKTHAPVDLKYDVLARPAVGEPFEVDLTWLPRAPADSLEAEVAGMPGLAVVEGAAGRIDGVLARSRHVMKVRVRADEPGLYYLGVTVRLVNKVQTDTRTFSVPVVVVPAPASGKAAPADEAIGQPDGAARAAADDASAGRPQ